MGDARIGLAAGLDGVQETVDHALIGPAVAAHAAGELVFGHIARAGADDANYRFIVAQHGTPQLAPDPILTQTPVLKQLEVKVAAHAVVPLQDDRLVVDDVVVVVVDAQVVAVQWVSMVL